MLLLFFLLLTNGPRALDFKYFNWNASIVVGIIYRVYVEYGWNILVILGGFIEVDNFIASMQMKQHESNLACWRSSNENGLDKSYVFCILKSICGLTTNFHHVSSNDTNPSSNHLVTQQNPTPWPLSISNPRFPNNYRTSTNNTQQISNTMIHPVFTKRHPRVTQYQPSRTHDLPNIHRATPNNHPTPTHKLCKLESPPMMGWRGALQTQYIHLSSKYLAFDMHHPQWRHSPLHHSLPLKHWTPSWHRPFDLAIMTTSNIA